MRRDDRGVMLFLSIAVAFYFASIAFAEKTNEDLRQAAYEQVEGPATGAGRLASAPVAANPGLKAAPASTRMTMTLSTRLPSPRPLPLAGEGDAQGRVRGFGIALSALLGLSIGGGVGFITSYYGAGGTEDRG